MSRALLSPRLRRRPRVGDGENKSEATLPEFSLTPAAVAYPGPAAGKGNNCQGTKTTELLSLVF